MNFLNSVNFEIAGLALLRVWGDGPWLCPAAISKSHLDILIAFWECQFSYLLSLWQTRNRPFWERDAKHFFNQWKIFIIQESLKPLAWRVVTKRYDVIWYKSILGTGKGFNVIGWQPTQGTKTLTIWNTCIILLKFRKQNEGALASD